VTRVSRRVVRRRKKGDDESDSVVTVRRRKAADVEPTPTADPVIEEPTVVEQEPVEAAPAQEVEAPVAEQPAEAVQAETAEPASESVAEPAEEAVEPVKAKEEPQQPETVEVAPGAEPKVEEPKVEEPKVEEPKDKEAGTEPPRPKFVGLGAAVIKPPPGYDPTNPTTWRRPPEAKPAPKSETKTRGRRRVAQTDHRGGGRGGRGGRRSGGSNSKMRRRAVGPKGSGTVAMKAEKRKVRIDNVISVGQLAHEMQLKASLIIRSLMEMGSMVTVNEMLDMDTATLVASEFGYEVENVGFQEDVILQQVQVDEDDGEQEPRPPVVTIMGHVDHGKTTLLDAIRSAKVAAGEAGGITQHIGAYQVECQGKPITFLDTPGHAAFTSMRARGAQVTDVVILVVAADDGVKDQTVEALNHAKAAGVPIIVAVNKMDKVGANPDNLKTQLSEHELLPEDWGGDTQFIPVSALKQEGLDELLDAILIQTEMLELTANAERPAEGIVIEAKVERGKGTVISVLIQKGTLRQGENIVVGTAFGRVRAMVDHTNSPVKVAPPSTPVELFGITGLPEVGDTVSVVTSEKDARTVADHRSKAKRENQFRNTKRRTAEDLFNAAARSQLSFCHVVLKTDVQGSVEAVKYALQGIEIEGTELRILHAAIGNITESDVILAAANDALLMGFNVKVDAQARKSAEAHGIVAELYKVIYDIIDRVERTMTGMLEPEFEEVRRGTIEVRAIFKISRLGTIAGCYVQDGRIHRNDKVRLVRGKKQLWEGGVSTLKRFKDDVKEVNAGYECGIGLDGFNDIEEGDLLEIYALEEITNP
jgi:translation initiation factor IF-2